MQIRGLNMISKAKERWFRETNVVEVNFLQLPFNLQASPWIFHFPSKKSHFFEAPSKVCSSILSHSKSFPSILEALKTLLHYYKKDIC